MLQNPLETILIGEEGQGKNRKEDNENHTLKFYIYKKYINIMRLRILLFLIILFYIYITFQNKFKKIIILIINDLKIQKIANFL